MFRSPLRSPRWLGALVATMTAAMAVAGTPATVYVYDNAGNLTAAIDTGIDPRNCGGMGVACSSVNITPSCVGGVCYEPCNAGWSDCDANKQTNGCETNIAADVGNCGGCGTLCSTSHITPSCVGGSCSCSCP